jgi:hypothetical protein
MKNMKKCLILVVFLAPHSWGNDPTMTNFDGWLDHNALKVYTKYENNPFEIVIWSFSFQWCGGGRQGQNQITPNFVHRYNDL